MGRKREGDPNGGVERGTVGEVEASLVYDLPHPMDIFSIFCGSVGLSRTISYDNARPSRGQEEISRMTADLPYLFLVTVLPDLWIYLKSGAPAYLKSNAAVWAAMKLSLTPWQDFREKAGMSGKWAFLAKDLRKLLLVGRNRGLDYAGRLKAGPMRELMISMISDIDLLVELKPKDWSPLRDSYADLSNLTSRARRLSRWKTSVLNPAADLREIANYLLVDLGLNPNRLAIRKDSGGNREALDVDLGTEITEDWFNTPLSVHLRWIRISLPDDRGRLLRLVLEGHNDSGGIVPLNIIDIQWRQQESLYQRGISNLDGLRIPLKAAWGKHSGTSEDPCRIVVVDYDNAGLIRYTPTTPNGVKFRLQLDEKAAEALSTDHLIEAIWRYFYQERMLTFVLGEKAETDPLSDGLVASLAGSRTESVSPFRSRLIIKSLLACALIDPYGVIKLLSRADLVTAPDEDEIKKVLKERGMPEEYVNKLLGESVGSWLEVLFEKYLDLGGQLKPWWFDGPYLLAVMLSIFDGGQIPEWGSADLYLDILLKKMRDWWGVELTYI